MLQQEKSFRKKRIFIGFNSAGSAGIYAFTRVLRGRGYHIDFYGLKKIHFNMPVDFLLEFSQNSFKSFFQRVIFFFKILPKYDIWHLNFMEVFFFYPVSLVILKLLGKKIVVTFRGIDVQTDLEFLPKSIYQKNPPEKWPLYYQIQFLRKNWRSKLLKKIRRQVFVWFADQVILTGPFLASSVSKYNKIIPYARDIKKNFIAKKNNKKLIVLHVPSDSVVKGSEIIEKTFKNLRKYKNIEFKILPKMPREELLLEMSKADIVIDQLLIGWYGGQAVEALAMGKIVLAYLNAPYLALSEIKNIPIINTNYWSIQDDLENIINNYQFFENKYAKKGFQFAKKYHSAEKIAEEYLEVYREAYCEN